MTLTDKLIPGGINRCDLYIFGWCLYYLQGTLYPESSPLSKSLLIALLLVSIGYAIYANIMYKLPAYLKGLNALLVMFTLYGFAALIMYGNEIVPLTGGVPVEAKNYLQTIAISLLSIYPFYIFAGQGYLTKEKLVRWLFIFFIIITLSFFREQRERATRIIEKNKSYSEEIETTINTGYVFLSIIPALFLLQKKPVIQYLGLLYCCTFVVMSAKRGAILICAVEVVLFLYFSFKLSSKRRKISILFLSVCAVLCLVFFTENRIQNSAYLNQRIEKTLEGNSSGRDEIYSTLIDHYISEREYSKLLIGNGAESTYRLSGSFAHQDWIEIMINQGLLGVILYAAYWICFLISIGKVKDPETRVILIMMFTLFFLKSLFSMSYGSMTYYTNSVIGYCLATGIPDKESQCLT